MNLAMWIGLCFLAIGALTPPAFFAFSGVTAMAPLLLAGYFLWPTFLFVGAVTFIGGLAYKYWKRRDD